MGKRNQNIIKEAAANKIYIVQKYVEKCNVGRKKKKKIWKTFFPPKMFFFFMEAVFACSNNTTKMYIMYRAVLIIIA